MRECDPYHPKPLPLRKAYQNYCTKYVVYGTHEQFKQCFASVNTGRQLYPGKSKGYDKYGYFVVDMSPHAEDKYHLRSHIFPNEVLIIYQ